MADTPPTHRIEQPLAELERAIVDEYVRGAGFDPATVHDSVDPEAHRVLALAQAYAAGKLTEVESRLHYVRSLRGQE
jgi:hypothetical protein